jgi:hypothetical protein
MVSLLSNITFLLSLSPPLVWLASFVHCGSVPDNISFYSLSAESIIPLLFFYFLDQM